MSDPQAKNRCSYLSTSQLIRYLLFLALGWAIAQILAYFESVIFVFTASAVLAFLLGYPVRWLQRFVSHGMAVSLVFVLSLAMFGGLFATLGLAILSQSQQLLDSAPELLSYTARLLEQLEQWLNQRNLQLDLTQVQGTLQSQALAGVSLGLATFQRVLTSLLNCIFIAVVTLFMLLDGSRLWYFCLQLFPSTIRTDLHTAIQRNFLGFFWGRLLLAIFFGTACSLVFSALQIPYALALATIAGVCDLIPGIGATLGISVVCLIILPQGVWLSVKVLVICILLQQIEENILMPRIMQESININPVVMFLALLIGAKVAGLFGLFLAIPIAGTVIHLFKVDDMKSVQYHCPD